MTAALSVNPRFDADNSRFVGGCLSALRGLTPFVESAYKKRLKSVESVRAANRWLAEKAADIEGRIKRCDLNLAGDDDEFSVSSIGQDI